MYCGNQMSPCTCRQNLVHERKHATVWDNYEIVKEIGHGMTGKVYQARIKQYKCVRIEK